MACQFCTMPGGKHDLPLEELARVIAGAYFDNSDDIPPNISRDEYIRRCTPHWLPEANAVLSYLRKVKI